MVESTVRWEKVELRDEKPTLVGTFQVDEAMVLEVTIMHGYTWQGQDVDAITLAPRLKHYYTWHVSNGGEPLENGKSVSPAEAGYAVTDACIGIQKKHAETRRLEIALEKLRHEGKQHLTQYLESHRASQ